MRNARFTVIQWYLRDSVSYKSIPTQCQTTLHCKGFWPDLTRGKLNRQQAVKTAPAPGGFVGFCKDSAPGTNGAVPHSFVLENHPFCGCKPDTRPQKRICWILDFGTSRKIGALPKMRCLAGFSEPIRQKRGNAGAMTTLDGLLDTNAWSRGFQGTSKSSFLVLFHRNVHLRCSFL